MDDDLAIPYGAETSSILVIVWRRLARGRADDARSLLMVTWSGDLDALSARTEGRVALRLFKRLGFSTDDEEEWAALPDPLTIWRVGRVGVSWTADRGVAEHHLAQMGKGARIRTGSVAKTDVLAFITNYGESEVILSPAVARRLSRIRRG